MPFVPDPLISPSCRGLALLGGFSLAHIIPHPKDSSSDTRRKPPPASTQQDQCSAGLSIQKSPEKPVWKRQQIASALRERTSVTSCVRGGFQESSLTHPGTSPRDKNLAGPLWWCLVCGSWRTHLQRRPETFAVRWEAAVLPSKRGKSKGFSVFFSLPTSVGQECASFQLQPKTSCSPTGFGFSRSTIPLREGEPKAE